MVEQPASDASNNSAPTSSCPADAKPANLDFTLKDIAGADVSLQSFKGKVIVLDFWATWCGPCKVEIPHFIEFQQNTARRDCRSSASRSTTLSTSSPRRVKEMGMNHPVLQGLGHDAVQDAYGPILGIPVSVMISRDGKVCATHTGLTGKDVFEQEIQSLL